MTLQPAGPVVTVAVALGPRQVVELDLQLPAGARLADALQAAQAAPALAEVVLAEMPAGIWGRAAAPSQLLRDGDRVECYRRLQVDPKVARRERFARQGARAAGLFARRRPGAKPGY
ncbi:RnfH family protein [Pseudorhodoferax sp.]|uniref:RnfH family protein n=1 Tax=Pseudorhodoferax sp. TaxID=1993553 RepID=UPI0039E663D3